MSDKIYRHVVYKNLSSQKIMAFVLLSPVDWALLQAGSAEAQDWWQQEQGTPTRIQRLQPENNQTRMLEENIDFYREVEVENKATFSS